MEFYIGGYAQGKLQYVLQTHQGENVEVIDGDNITEFANDIKKKVIFNHFHLWVKREIEEGRNPEQQIKEFIKRYENCIIISDEIGNGIVPMELQERNYRERLGRIQIELATRAERVERVICGIGQRLK